MDVRLPDGRIIRNVPEGTTKAQLVQKLQAGGIQVPAEWMQGGASPEGAARQLEQDRKTYDPTVGMSGGQRFLAGVGKAITDVGRGVRQYLPQAVGGMTNEQVAEARALDQPLMNTGAGIAGNIAGNVALAAPTVLVPGAATIPGAAAVGAAYGALQPGVNTEERLKNTAIGGVAGAAVPAVVRGAQVARSFVDPLYQGGRDRIIGSTIRRAAGDQADEAMAAMRGAGEIVPGSAPTAAEAAQNPGIAALQRAATAADPVAMNQVAARQASQNEARIAALRGVTPDVQAAEAARSAAAGPMYDAARQAGFDPATVQQLQPQITALMQRVPEDLVIQAQRLARVEGVPIDDMGSVQGAHYLKRVIDRTINQAKLSGDGDTARAFSGLQTEFLNVLDQLNPAYQQARQTFAQMSPPITQGQVLEAVGQRATNFRGEMTPAAFSRAMGDQTARNVTGRPVGMADVLTPEQMATLGNIRDDLLRSDFAQTAGRGVGSDTVQKMAFNNMMAQSGLPSALQNFPALGVVGNLGQRFGQVVYRDANERMAQQLAQALLDPQQAAQLMEAGMVTPQMQALVNGLRRGGAAIGASTPGLIQANQE